MVDKTVKTAIKEYTLIPDDASKVLWEKVNQWFNESTAKNLFADAKGICKAAVAEYLANQDGHTVYASVAKRDADWYAREATREIREQEAQAERNRIEREKQEAQRKKDEAEYQAAISKLTPKELRAIERKSRRR
jgi:hypothetical protein